ncbi:MAG: hypothetical protein Q8Q31_04440 [Nanoarchaeota archaeon]|nr:hypothetical protein [Nanoarchaeota archaeon]
MPNNTQPDHRKELIQKLDSYDLGRRIQGALNSGSADKAAPKLKAYTEQAFIEREAAKRGVSVPDYTALYNSYDDADKNSLLLSFLPAREGLDRLEAAKYLKGNLEEILKEDANKADLTKILDKEEAIGRLDAIAQVKGDDAARDDLREYSEYVSLGKQMEKLKRYEANLGNDADEKKKKKGDELLAEAPARYREAIRNMAVRVAVEEARSNLLKKGYDQQTANALAETDQTIARIDPSYDLIKKAIKKVLEEEEKTYSGKDGKGMKERLYNHLKSNIGYAMSSGNRELEEHALNLTYAAFNGSGDFIGRKKI